MSLDYKLLEELPCDLKRKIKQYLVINQLYCCSKNNWEKYIKIKVNSLLLCNIGLIRYNTFNTYIRFIIRAKLAFIFKKVIQFSKWKFTKFKKFIYKGKKWNNYIDFLKWYCRNQQSGKCLISIINI